MALPLILVGAAILAGGAGVAAGVSAKGDFDEAERKNERAKRIFKDAERSLKQQRKSTQKRLEKLGRQKVELHRSGLKPFVDTFSRIKNVEYAGVRAGEDLPIREDQVLSMHRAVMETEEVVGAGAGALGAGALAGFATYGSVGLLGTASTGTAIAGLSGAAATNATLAWLGGGSLAAGGLGMAGGAAVLGGIVAAPVLLVGGLYVSAKADEALADARSNVKEAKVAAEAMETAEVAAAAIRHKAKEVSKVLQALKDDHLDDALIELISVVSVNDDYRTYSEEQKHLVMRTVAVAKTAHLVAEAPLFDEDGVVTKRIRKTLKRANDFLRAIRAT